MPKILLDHTPKTYTLPNGWTLLWYKTDLTDHVKVGVIGCLSPNPNHFFYDTLSPQWTANMSPWLFPPEVYDHLLMGTSEPYEQVRVIMKAYVKVVTALDEYRDMQTTQMTLLTEIYDALETIQSSDTLFRWLREEHWENLVEVETYRLMFTEALLAELDTQQQDLIDPVWAAVMKEAAP